MIRLWRWVRGLCYWLRRPHFHVRGADWLVNLGRDAYGFNHQLTLTVCRGFQPQCQEGEHAWDHVTLMHLRSPIVIRRL